MTEKLCLKWNDFQDNIHTSFENLRDGHELTDVSLVCEDGHQVEAHKVILALSCPFFRSLLKKNNHPHPLIYMRGVKSDDLDAIVEFLYCGEANVYQDNIDAFLAIAEELKLKGLTGNAKHEQTEEHINEEMDVTKSQMQTKIENIKPYETQFHNIDPSYPISSVNISNIDELEETVKSMMT